MYADSIPAVASAVAARRLRRCGRHHVMRSAGPPHRRLLRVGAAATAVAMVAVAVCAQRVNGARRGASQR